MHIGKTVTLDIGEQNVCKLQAKERNDSNRSTNVKNCNQSTMDDYKVNLEGVGAELAFCKIFGLYPDFTIFCRSSALGEDEGDAVRNGNRVDVKSTHYYTGKLQTPIWKVSARHALKIDYYALMVGTFPTYTFRGFMDVDDLITPERITKLREGSSPCYVAAQSELCGEIKNKQALKKEAEIISTLVHASLIEDNDLLNALERVRRWLNNPSTPFGCSPIELFRSGRLNELEFFAETVLGVNDSVG